MVPAPTSTTQCDLIGELDAVDPPEPRHRLPRQLDTSRYDSWMVSVLRRTARRIAAGETDGTVLRFYEACLRVGPPGEH